MASESTPAHRVLFFARTREIAGRDSVEIGASGLSRVRDIAAALAERFPELGPYLETCRFAVNEEFQPLDAELPTAAVSTGGLEIAVIPPVSGGL